MVKFSKKWYTEEYPKYENWYNHHPYTSYCTPEFMVKRLGWGKCKSIYLDWKETGYTSKVIHYTEDYQYEFFLVDLQHLLSFYYEDIPNYY